jgi:prefoldin subunit 5
MTAQELAKKIRGFRREIESRQETIKSLREEIHEIEAKEAQILEDAAEGQEVLQFEERPKRTR